MLFPGILLWRQDFAVGRTIYLFSVNYLKNYNIKFTRNNDNKICECKIKVKRQRKAESVFQYSKTSFWVLYAWQLKKLALKKLT